MTEQMLVLVDENDKFLSKYASKSKCHTGKGLHHRAFTIMILNKKGEVLLQKRNHQLWDGFWDLTNSHPLHQGNSKDTYREAAQRCLKREWGVEIPVKKIFGFNYFTQHGDFCENEYCAFLVGEYNGGVHPNPEVIYEYKWIALEGLLKEIKFHLEVYTPWAIKAFQEFKKKRVKLRLKK